MWKFEVTGERYVIKKRKQIMKVPCFEEPLIITTEVESKVVILHFKIEFSAATSLPVKYLTHRSGAGCN